MRWPGRVREAVEQRERRVAAVQHELLVGPAEDAAARLVGLLDYSSRHGAQSGFGMPRAYGALPRMKSRAKRAGTAAATMP